jgi:hypothetical protein
LNHTSNPNSTLLNIQWIKKRKKSQGKLENRNRNKQIQKYNITKFMSYSKSGAEEEFMAKSAYIKRQIPQINLIL